MKQTVAVLCLLAVLSGSVIWNALYINKVTTRFTEQVGNLPPFGDPACPAAAAALLSDWERVDARVELTAGYTLTDRAHEQASLLASCAASGDAFGYASAYALFRDALRDLARAERFSPGSLF